MNAEYDYETVWDGTGSLIPEYPWNLRSGSTAQTMVDVAPSRHGVVVKAQSSAFTDHDERWRIRKMAAAGIPANVIAAKFGRAVATIERAIGRK